MNKGSNPSEAKREKRSRFGDGNQGQQTALWCVATRHRSRQEVKPVVKVKTKGE